jgi:ubiquinone biosynthesis protein
MAAQVGWQGMLERLKAEAPRYTHVLPQLPRLLHRALEQAGEPPANDGELRRVLIAEQQRTNRLLSFVVYFAGAFGLGVAGFQLYLRWHNMH